MLRRGAVPEPGLETCQSFVEDGSGAPPPLGSPHLIVPMRAQRGRRPPGTSDDRRPDDPRCRRPHLRAPPGGARHRRAAPAPVSGRRRPRPAGARRPTSSSVSAVTTRLESGAPHRVRRVRARAMAGRAARLPRARRGPRARVRADGEPRRSGASPRRRGRPARARRLDRASPSARPGPRIPTPTTAGPPLVRREFTARGDRSPRARLYVTAHGLYEVEINGAPRRRRRPVARLDRLPRRACATTPTTSPALVRRGANAIGAWLGDGWYRGSIGFDGGTRNLYGTDQSLIAQLEIALRRRHARRRRDRRGRGARPRPDRRAPASTTARPTTPAARAAWLVRTARGTSRRRLDARSPSARATPRPSSPRRARPCAAREEVAPVERASRRRAARRIARLRPEPRRPPADPRRRRGRRHGHHPPRRGARGRRARTRPLRAAQSTDTYIAAGRRRRGVGAAVHLPRLPLRRDRRLAGRPRRRVATATRRAGLPHRHASAPAGSSASDPLVNRLHENVVWSMRGNFVDMPTDCPQRDERLGWTGDIQVFAPTAAFLYDCAGMLDSLAQGRRASSSCPTARCPGTCPSSRASRCGRRSSPGRPGAMSRRSPRGCSTSGSATSGILAAQYESAKAWVDLDRPARRARPPVGRPGSSSATGSTRPRRPTTRPTAAPTSTSSRRRTSPGRRGTSRGSPRCSAERRATPSATARSPTRCAPRSARDYVAARRPHDQRRADRVRARDRSSTSSPTPRSAHARRRPPRRARRRGRQPHRHRLRRHAARLRRADRRTAHLDAAYRPAARRPSARRGSTR